jgi:hypothetical protein
MSPGPCQLSSGFLLPHPCPNAAIGPCAKCGRETCEEHGELAAAGLLCRACATGSELPPLLKTAAGLAGLGGAAAIGGAAALAGAATLFPLFDAQDVQAFEEAADLAEDDAEQFADLS